MRVGWEYFQHPSLLEDSFVKMNKKKKVFRLTDSKIKRILSMIYIWLFGIPDIGFQIRAKAVIETLKSNQLKKNKILDVGSGIGYYLLQCSRLSPESKIRGIDTDRYKVKATQKIFITNKKIQITLNDITKITMPSAQFDLIICVDVLEHINHYKKALLNMYNLLKSGGVLILHTPQNKQTRIIKSYFSTWSHSDHSREGYDPDQLSSQLNSLGFRIVKTKKLIGWLGMISWELCTMAFEKNPVIGLFIYPLFSLFADIDYLLSKLFASYANPSLTCLFVCQKPVEQASQPRRNSLNAS